MANFLTPAAEYVRMSTVKQEYSILNQQRAIAEYASLHGFQVIRTYSDPGKSGLEVKHREGLIQLLRDVTNGSCAYKAILVYDVSRWGRFQDNDEAAYLEFVCKSAGAPIHYCSEPFANDCTVPSLIMKALKRTMAGEYSRELGNRIYAAQKRMVTLGFKMGAKAMGLSGVSFIFRTEFRADARRPQPFRSAAKRCDGSLIAGRKTGEQVPERQGNMCSKRVSSRRRGWRRSYSVSPRGSLAKAPSQSPPANR